MTWKFNKGNWTYIAEDNIEEFLNGVSKDVKEGPTESIKPKTKRSKKTKQVVI